MQYDIDMIDSKWPCDTIWWYRSETTLVQVMACCPRAPSHNLNQCWLTTNLTESAHYIISRKWVWKIHLKNYFHISQVKELRFLERNMTIFQVHPMKYTFGCVILSFLLQLYIIVHAKFRSLWFICPYSWGLLQWHWDNHTEAIICCSPIQTTLKGMGKISQCILCDKTQQIINHKHNTILGMYWEPCVYFSECATAEQGSRARFTTPS